MEPPASQTLPAWLLGALSALVAKVLRTLIDIVAFLLLKLITPAPAATAPRRHGTSLELNIVITLQTPQHSTRSSSSDPARVGTPTVTATLRDLESPTRHIAEDQPPRTLGRIRSFLATNTSMHARGRDGLNVHPTPPLAVLERYIAAVREDIAQIEDLGEARAIGLEDAGEDLLEAGADEDTVTNAPGHYLNLPTQQELLAQFQQSIGAGTVIGELGEVMRTWRSQALSRYDREALRYHQALERHRADLVKTLDFTLLPLFLGQLQNLHKAALMSFNEETNAGLKVDGYDFADVVTKARSGAEAVFSDGAREAVIVEGDTTWEEELRLLRNEIRSMTVQLRRGEAKKVADAIEEQIAEPVGVQLQRPTPLMWDKILRVYKDALANAENSYLRAATSFDFTDEEHDEALTTLRCRAWAALRAKIDEQTTDTEILTKLRTYFEERFRYDELRVPRVWKPEDDIDGAFKKAKSVALELISLYAKIEPEDPELEYTPPDNGEDDTPGLVVFSETKVLELGARFRREADAQYVEAKRSTVVGIVQILYRIFAILAVVLGCGFFLFSGNPLYFFILGWLIIWLN